MIRVGIGVVGAAGAVASGYPATLPANLGSQPRILEGHLLPQPIVDGEQASLRPTPCHTGT